tara:strand:+ start:749 stop:955 length:207 start_codon:yes stop_codon:yes gene_type:complete
MEPVWSWLGSAEVSIVARLVPEENRTSRGNVDEALGLLEYPMEKQSRRFWRQVMLGQLEHQQSDEESE